jgi:lipooligosaccharide transport system ATP-binding protein
VFSSLRGDVDTRHEYAVKGDGTRVHIEDHFTQSRSRHATHPGCTVSENHILEARQLVKRFGDFEAVRGIDVAIDRGESFGFLGPNGAGKTSTMRMISAVSQPTSGVISIFGLDPRTDGPEIRGRLGVVPQEDSLELELSVRHNLEMFGRYYDLPRRVVRERAIELLEFTQLSERANDKVDNLSGGMKRRLTIARGLINRPEILILDEPTTGLDPQARHLLWDRLYRLKREGVTLIITTHYMDEAEQLCDRLVVMDQGSIVAEGAPRALIERFSTREVVELRFMVDDHEEYFERLSPFAERVEVLPDRVLLYVDDGDDTLRAVHAAHITPSSALVRRSSLEDVFLHLTGRSLTE